MRICNQDGDLATKGRALEKASNACLQCQQRKKRCDRISPKCSSCSERSLTCTYLPVRRRGRGKTNKYLERLEARVAELEASQQLPADIPLEPTKSKVDTGSQLVEDESVSYHITSGICPRMPPIQTSPDPDRTQTSNVMASGCARPVPTVAHTVHLEGKVSRELPPKTVTSSAFTNDQDRSSIKEKLFAALPEQQAVKSLMSEASYGPFFSPIFIPLPPKSQVESIFEFAFEEINYVLPLFHAQVLNKLLQEHYAGPIASSGKDPTRWAMINSALAVAIQLRLAPNSKSEITKVSWCFFKNAYSVYSAISLQGTSVLAVEALLAMAIFMQGTNDTRTTSHLVHTAARLSLALGLHQESYVSGLDSTTKNRIRRVFWISFILDKEISVLTGLPSTYDDNVASFNSCDSIETASLGVQWNSGTNLPSVLFRCRVELAAVARIIEKDLRLELLNDQDKSGLQGVVRELDHRLEEWKESLPSDLRPGYIIWSETPPLARESIVSLHFSYYQALITIYTFLADSKQENSHNADWRAGLSRSSPTFAASQIIHLLEFLPPQQPGRLWYILCYPLSACITLFRAVIEGPTDTKAISHVHSMDLFVKFLNRIDLDEAPGVQNLLDLCREFQSRALYTVSQMASSTSSANNSAPAWQKETEISLTCQDRCKSSIQLAQGLMGNIPSLRSTAFELFSSLIPEWHTYPFSKSVAPPLLLPENYNFSFA